MDKKEALQDSLAQLEEISSTIELLAQANEGRSRNVELLMNDSTAIKNDIDTICKYLAKIEKTSDTLHILAINTAIQAAKISNGKEFSVIAIEMKELNSSFINLKEEIEELANDISKKIQVFVQKLEVSAQGVIDTGASLEELTAASQELVSSIEINLKE